MTYDGDTGVFTSYTNGVFESTSTKTGTKQIKNDTDNTGINAFPESPGFYYKAGDFIIDDVRVYNTTLPAAAIAQLYLQP